MRTIEMGVTISLLTAGLVGLIGTIELVSPNPIVNDIEIETIEFSTQNDLLSTQTVYIETSGEAVAANRNDVLFIKSSDDAYQLIEREDKDAIRIVTKTPYTVYVPADRVKELSEAHAKELGESLTFGTEE